MKEVFKVSATAPHYSQDQHFYHLYYRESKIIYLLSVCIQENKLSSEVGHNLLKMNMLQKKKKIKEIPFNHICLLTSFLRLIDILKIAVEASKAC